MSENEQGAARRPESQLLAARARPAADAAASTRAQATPLYLTSGFSFDSAEQGRALFAGEQAGYIYSRYDNPNTTEFIEKMCRLEGAEAGLATATGMAAIFTVLAGLLNSGDHVVAGRSLFSSSHHILTQILPRWGITHSYAPVAATPEAWASLMKPTTRVCLIETPTNPTLEVIDIAALAALCQARDIILVVDNVFATPILQQPLSLGADLVVHSATKFIDGQGRALGGVIVGDRFLIDDLRPFARHTGPALSPFNAWLFSQSLEHLPVRLARQSASALAVARFLAEHPAVSEVRYPFLPSHPQHEIARRQMRDGGALVALTVTGGAAAARRMQDRLQLILLASNLGDSRTIITHPATTTHHALGEDTRAAVGISAGLLRLAVGLEHVEDIVADLTQALAA